jgi:GGDEF domain-containing protein
MTNLKRSFFWAAFYLAVIFILGQMDYIGRPIINFASYFYLAIILSMPITLFLPSISRVPSYVPLFVWAGIYMVLLQILGRLSANAGELSVIILEFVLLEAGVWFAYQLAVQLGHAESIMDALALSAFPNSAHDVDLESQRIKVEITRSRRYHRPLSLLLLDVKSDDETITKELLKSVQHDLMNRFTTARIGQIIDDRIRQTDLILKDSHGRFAILCPETDTGGVALLAERIVQAVRERTSLQIFWGVASFPDDALTFDDLLLKARDRLKDSASSPTEQVAVLNSADQGSRV